MSTAVAETTSASTSFRPTRSYTNPRDVTDAHDSELAGDLQPISAAVIFVRGWIRDRRLVRQR